MTHVSEAIIELSMDEVEEVSGGGFFLPLVYAFGKGVLTGGTAAGVAVAVGETVGLLPKDTL